MWEAWLLKKQFSNSSEKEIYNHAYASWYECWAPIYNLIDKDKGFYSDQFTRQDEVLVLLHGGKCAATVFFRYADFNSKFEFQDSYFGPWPEIAIKGLISEGPKVLVCSFFTVMEDFRKGYAGVSVKDLLMGMLIRRFMWSDFDVMTGSLRNSKGVNDLCYKWGATPLCKNVEFNNERNDLVGFYHPTIKPNAIPELTTLLGDLWNSCLGQSMSIKEIFKKAS